jgi:acyl-homoserine-lactone acylase
MVTERMAATDGIASKPGFTLGNLQRMWLGDRSLAAELAKDALHQICVDNPRIDIGGGTTVNVTKACPIIAAYNETGKLHSPGGWLFNLWWSETSGAGFWKDSFDPSHPLTTPHVVDTTNPDSIRTLGVVVKQMRDRGIPLDASYGDVQYAAAQHGRRIPIHGCNTGCWQDIESPIDDSSAVPYAQAYYGSSTVQFTKLTEHGPKGAWVLTYSQSDRPGSRHHSDQTRLFSKSKFVPMRFTEKEIKADPHLHVYRVGAKRGR